ncbi:hypothetical protein [Paenibacillus silagei]|uniref:Holin n=1 Tax=Paenibacillus silagei TaxID=1670801 RepID=A0ABS4NYC9_9BACL|nr:hypothetical protein [Paenibacillus silagei]MBP2115072.1 hypothetical protein [Paenibacillus silagei]
MIKKQFKNQQASTLFLASLAAIAASQVIQPNGSNVMDFSQGLLLGMGLVGMMMTLVTLGKSKKRSE